mmetsp:Transcript_112692/g.224159  ORF Transcript_112692/g.224159 Transcript_112692/m.224159 type:complete len:409 (-) Transcript_112692:94-1320(-)
MGTLVFFKATHRAWFVLPLVGLAALIWSGHSLFVLPLPSAAAAWRTWATLNPEDHNAHSSAGSGGPNAVRTCNTAGTLASVSTAAAFVAMGYSQTIRRRHQKARVEQKGSTRDEIRALSKKIDQLRDAAIISNDNEVPARNSGPASSSYHSATFPAPVWRPDDSQFSDAPVSTHDQIRALEREVGGRRKRWPLGRPSRSRNSGLDDTAAFMSTKDQIRAMESLGREERGGFWSMLFGGRRKREFAYYDYPVQGPGHEAGALGGYEAEASPYQPMAVNRAESEATAMIEASLFAAEEFKLSPVNKDVETTSAVTGSSELAGMEAKWSTVISAQQEKLQEVLATAERLDAELAEANSRIEELEEDLLLCRCKLVTEKPGAIGAISTEDRTTTASDEASSAGVKPPPRLSD